MTYDERKRAWTLEQRGLDFADAAQVFEAPILTIVDDRQDYGEIRYQTLGVLREVVVMVVWTPRSDVRHIISMRRGNGRERERYRRELERSR